MVGAARSIAHFFVSLVLAYFIGFMATGTLMQFLGPWVGLWIPLGCWAVAMWMATRPPTSSGVALGILGGGLVGIGGATMVFTFANS